MLAFMEIQVLNHLTNFAFRANIQTTLLKLFFKEKEM